MVGQLPLRTSGPQFPLIASPFPEFVAPRLATYRNKITHHADVVLLCECGVIGVGFLEDVDCLLQPILSLESFFQCQSPYACIIGTPTTDITTSPTSTESLSPTPSHHYREAQHLQVALRHGAHTPMVLDHLHSPFSSNNTLKPEVRNHIARLLRTNVGAKEHAFVGGDLNSSVLTLDQHMGKGWDYDLQPNALHGDVAFGKGIQAEAIPAT